MAENSARTPKRNERETTKKWEQPSGIIHDMSEQSEGFHRDSEKSERRSRFHLT